MGNPIMAYYITMILNKHVHLTYNLSNMYGPFVPGDN